MSIIAKINSRINLVFHNLEMIKFSIEGKRIATFYTQSDIVHSAILTFLSEGISLYKLKNYQTDGFLSRFFLFFENLKKNGYINYHFHLDDENQVILQPSSEYFKEESLSCENLIFEKSRYTISRFVYVRTENNYLLLESPLVPFQLSLVITNATQLSSVIEIIKTNELSLSHPIENKTERTLLKLLVEYGMLRLKDETANDDHLKFWEFHDLIFHSYSRRGRFDDHLHFGPTYRFHEKFKPPATFKDLDILDAIYLYKPNLKELMVNDKSFTEVLENRKSIRGYNKDKFINLKKLGEFLYRSIAIREVIKTSQQDATFRPYPAAGAIHGIEFYLVINSCEGILPDIYYYHPNEHLLFRNNVNKHYIEKIIYNAKACMGATATEPHIVFVLTSSFKKTSWKYEKIAYRSTLVSMGAVFQTMSLVATSMNLASCILGSGNSFLFAEALKNNLLEEGAIGEFALGIS
jgi:oxazoline/thiazoline dehydrogenase